MSQRFAITQGEYCVAAEPGATISTLLGSCIACCLWDPAAAVGGMNHILLANGRGGALCDNSTGVHAMELLINGLLRLGARRENLFAKTFGGAQMVAGLSDIGPANCAFVAAFLKQENIVCVSQSLGGQFARHVVFTPATGAARMKIQNGRVEEDTPAMSYPVGNGLELF